MLSFVTSHRVQNSTRVLCCVIWIATVVFGACAQAADSQPSLPRVTVSALPADSENHVVDLELPAKEMAGLLGQQKAGAIAGWDVWELDGSGKRTSQKFATFVADQAGGGTLFWLMDGKTAAGAQRSFELQPSTASASTGKAPSDFKGVSVRKDGSQIVVSNGIYEVMHDSEKGGSITAVAWPGTKKRLPLNMSDGVKNHSLLADGNASIRVQSLASDKGVCLGAVIEVDARYTSSKAKRDECPQANYRYVYRANAPVVRMTCRVPEQNVGDQYPVLQVLSLELQANEVFEVSDKAVPANIRPGGDGRLMVWPAVWDGYHGMNRPIIGYFFNNNTEGFAFVCPLLSMSAVDAENNVLIKPVKGGISPWTGESVEVSGSLLVGSSDRVQAAVPMAENPSVTVMLPTLSARLQAVSESAGNKAPAVREAVRLLARAAEQRIESLCGLTEAGELLTAAESLVAKKQDDAPVQVVETPSFLALANGKSAVLLKTGPHGASLENIGRNGFSFLKPSSEGRSFWHGLLCNEGRSQWFRVSSTEGDNVQRTIERPEPGMARVNLKWSGLKAGNEPVRAEVVVTMRDNDPMSRWQLTLQPEGKSLGLWTYAFPSVSGVVGDRRSSTTDFALVPMWSGRRWSNPRYSARSSDTYPGTGVPFAAYWQGNNGLYVGVHDGDTCPRQIDTTSNGDEGFGVHIENWFADMGKPGAGVKPEKFEAVIGAYEGDWYEAAGIYREWVLKQDWFPKETLVNSTILPQWAKDAVVAWRYTGGMRDNSAAAVRWTLEQSKAVGNPPAIFWWYQDGDLKLPPDVKPNGAGSDLSPNLKSPPGFGEAVSTLREHNIHTFAYLICYWWDYTREDWKTDQAEKGVVIRPGGHQSLYAKRKIGRMCVGSDVYQQKMRRVINNLVDVAPAVSGVYFDLGACGDFEDNTCFATDHGHPQGGGAWRTQAMRDLLYGMTAEAKKRAPGFTLITEAPCEMFINDTIIPLVFTIDVPATEAAFGDYMGDSGMKESMMYGAPCEALLPARQFAYGALIGRFRGKEMLDLEATNKQKKEVFDPMKVAFYKRLVQHKVVAKQWLNYGRMLKPLAVTQIQPASPAQWPADTWVPASVWRAPDGSTALVFANGRTSTQVSFNYKFDPKAYGLPTDGSLSLFKLTPEGEKPQPKYEKIGALNGVVDRTEILPPGEVLILVVK